MRTAWQDDVDGQIRECTAGHCVLWDETPTEHTNFWGKQTYLTAHSAVLGQISTRQLGETTGDDQIGFFVPRSAIGYPTEDVAFTTSVPALPGSDVRASAPRPLGNRALTITNGHDLRAGEEGAHVGDAQGSGHTAGPPTVSYLHLYFVGLEHDLVVHADSRNVPKACTVPEVGVFYGNTKPRTDATSISTKDVLRVRAPACRGRGSGRPSPVAAAPSVGTSPGPERNAVRAAQERALCDLSKPIGPSTCGPLGGHSGARPATGARRCGSGRAREPRGSNTGRAVTCAR